MSEQSKEFNRDDQDELLPKTGYTPCIYHDESGHKHIGARINGGPRGVIDYLSGKVVRHFVLIETDVEFTDFQLRTLKNLYDTYMRSIIKKFDMSKKCAVM